jgi:hypothetical protein
MDKRLIENIKDCELGLDTVEKLRPVTFNKKNSSKKEIGLIAQDVNESLLTSTNVNGIHSVNYEQIVPVLVNAIKELKGEVDELKSKRKK